MNYDEIKQLRTYARYDGVYLGIIWMASFACFLAITWQGMLLMCSLLLMLYSPFFVASRLKSFRNEALGGVISFKRALFYCIRVFFNGSLLFAMMQWVYMRFIDNGKLLNMVSSVINVPENDQLFKAMGLNREEYLQVLALMFEPFAFAASSFIRGCLFGTILSFIIAAILARTINTKQQYS